MNPFPIKRLVRRVGIAIASVVILAATALVWDGLHDDIGHADLGLVLGNTVNQDGTASPRLAARLEPHPGTLSARTLSPDPRLNG